MDITWFWVISVTIISIFLFMKYGILPLKKLRKKIEDRDKQRQIDNNLWVACENNNIKLVKSLVQQGANINQYKKIDFYWNYRGTLLHLAVCHNFVEIVKILVENGIDVNIRDSYILPPLHHAINSDIIRLLIYKTNDLNCKDEWGCSLLDLAKLRKNKESIRIIENEIRYRENKIKKKKKYYYENIIKRR